LNFDFRFRICFGFRISNFEFSFPPFFNIQISEAFFGLCAPCKARIAEFGIEECCFALRALPLHVIFPYLNDRAAGRACAFRDIVGCKVTGAHSWAFGGHGTSARIRMRNAMLLALLFASKRIVFVSNFGYSDFGFVSDFALRPGSGQEFRISDFRRSRSGSPHDQIRLNYKLAIAHILPCPVRLDDPGGFRGYLLIMRIDRGDAGRKVAGKVGIAVTH